MGSTLLESNNFVVIFRSECMSYNILKIVMIVGSHNKAFINVRLEAVIRPTATPHFLSHCLHKPTHQRDSANSLIKFCFRSQNRSYNFYIRLPCKYLYMHSGMIKYMNASVTVYVYALVLLDRAQEFN